MQSVVPAVLFSALIKIFIESVSIERCAMVTERDILELSDQIVIEFSPKRIILFGSYARNEATEDSDVDLLIIMNFSGSSFKKSVEILNSIKPKIPIDLIAKDETDFSDRLKSRDPFVLEIVNQGKVLYEYNK